MNYKTIEEIEARISAIKSEMNAEGADLDALTKEVDELEARKAELTAEVEKRNALASRIAAGQTGTVVKNFPAENRATVDPREIRNSEKYINAYAEYMKTGDDTEVRALLTENVSGGTIAVPDFVYDIVKTAWDNNNVMKYVPKTEIAGNLKINFEISGTDAVDHIEGSGPVAEEELTEGIVTLIPVYTKKWISISDEVMAMRGRKFLEYIYRELAHKIVKLMADKMVAAISALPQVATATSPNADLVTTAPAMATVSEAIGHLSDEASNPIVIMNKLTWSEFKRIKYANNYAADPFEGLTVEFNNSLPAYSAADEGDVYMIVGDLGQGTLANFPEGETIRYTFDELTRKKEDLVEVMGKEYNALGVIACKAFTLVAKPATI